MKNFYKLEGFVTFKVSYNAFCKHASKVRNMQNIIKERPIKLTAVHNGRHFLADASYINNNTPKPVMLFIHGFKGFKDWGHWHLVAQYFAQAGFVFVKMNLSHNGTTPESPTDFADPEAFGNNNFSISLDDIGAVIDYLFQDAAAIGQQNIDTSSCYLIGHSLGGALALLKAAEDTRIKKVVTWAGVHNLREWLEKESVEEWKKAGVRYVVNSRTGQQLPLYYQVYEDMLVNSARLDLPSIAPKLNTPVLVLQGTDDPAVSTDAARALAGWCKAAELIIIDGADHVFGGRHPYHEPALPARTQLICEKTRIFLTKRNTISL